MDSGSIISAWEIYVSRLHHERDVDLLGLRRGWLSAFGAEDRWFYSPFSRHAETLGKSFSRNCLYDVMWRPVASMRLKFDSSNSLLSSMHTFLVHILRCVRLYIKRKYYIHSFILTISIAPLQVLYY